MKTEQVLKRRVVAALRASLLDARKVAGGEVLWEGARDRVLAAAGVSEKEWAVAVNSCYPRVARA